MRQIYYLLIYLGFHAIALSQSADKQIVDHVFSFVQNIDWPQEKSSYKVRVITQDRSLTDTFRSLAATTKADGKPIEVGFNSYISIPSDVDVLFISSVYNQALQTVIERIGDKPILIVTEQSPDQQYVMINLLRNGENISFEFNRANIKNQRLAIKQSFERLGGKEINVAQLYRQVRDSMRIMESRTVSVKDTIETLKLRMAIARRLLRENNESLVSLKEEIEEKQLELDGQNEVLDLLTKKLSESEDQLVQLEADIKEQEAALEENIRTLDDQEELINQRNRQIENKEIELGKMERTVDTQQNQLMLLISFAVFLVIILIVAYRAYQARRKAAKVLNQQKEELKDLLDELQSTQTQLVQSEKMASLGVLTAGIAHEINNAINYVYSGIHVLDSKFSEIKPLMSGVRGLGENKENLEAKVDEILKKKEEVEYDSSEEVIGTIIKSIQVGAERTIDIVKGLRTFSRAQEESMSEMDIHDDINVALLLLKNKIKHNVKIKKDLAKKLPVMFGYSGQVGQAILNIIGNALDAIQGREDPKILIRTVATGNIVKVSIRDNGVGIKKDDLDKIFDPFYTTKKIGEGTGLGLSITYGIIEKHNGSIKVESKVGVGTEFKIELPLNDQPVS